MGSICKLGLECGSVAVIFSTNACCKNMSTHTIAKGPSDSTTSTVAVDAARSLKTSKPVVQMPTAPHTLAAKSYVLPSCRRLALALKNCCESFTWQAATELSSCFKRCVDKTDLCLMDAPCTCQQQRIRIFAWWQSELRWSRRTNQGHAGQSWSNHVQSVDFHVSSSLGLELQLAGRQTCVPSTQSMTIASAQHGS